MAKSGWSCVLITLLVTAVVACSKPAIEEEREFAPTEDPPPSTIEAEANDLPTVTSEKIPTQVQPTDPPPPLPTARPTSSFFSTWQQTGSEATGLQLLVPPEWINLSGRLDTPTATNPLGLIVLLVTDSERSGNSLLSGKPLGEGAYVAGLVSRRELSPNTPQTTLSQLVADLGEGVTILSEPTPVTAFTTSGSLITGAYVDVAGRPLIFASEQEAHQTRLFLFTSTLAGAVTQDTQALFLMSAPQAYWADVEDTFTDMAITFVIHNLEDDLTIRDGAANVIGQLEEVDLVDGALASGVKDVWTFQIDEPRYASLTLRPDDLNLDLLLTLISPSGQTLLQVDNGYAGDIETAVDQLLLEPGLYVVEIGEFFNTGGRYQLALVLTEEPIYGGGGQIGIGQTIQSELAPQGEHLWTFTANAGTLISLVLDPADFDVVLDLFAPDGRQLVGLDEGFSSDAEVVAGLELPLTGEYTVLVRSFAGDGGSYTLSLDTGGEETINFYDAGDLSYGDSRQETLQPNEAHAWFFNGLAGDEIMADVIPLADSQIDLDIWLLDPNIERLTAVDKVLTGEPELLTYTLPEDGQYIILVREFFGESGNYEISLQGVMSGVPVPAGGLTPDESVSGTLAVEETVIWNFEGRTGETISALLLPAAGTPDLRLILVDPAGNRLVDVDNGSAGQGEQIEAFQITTDGQWGLVVEEFFDEAASYTLRLTQTP